MGSPEFAVDSLKELQRKLIMKLLLLSRSLITKRTRTKSTDGQRLKNIQDKCLSCIATGKDS
jgi:hypothetical protein